MVDLRKAFEVNEGILVNLENAGTFSEGPFLTGGTISPVGLNLPEKTIYLQNTAAGIIIWRKFGNGVNDWRQLSAQDIPFVPTTTDLTSFNSQAAIEELANRHYGKDFDSKTKESGEDTTGNSFDEYDNLAFNVSDTSGTNKYRIAVNFFYGHSSASNDIRARLLLDGASVYEIRVEPKDPSTAQRIPAFIIDYPENLSNGSHNISLEYRPASSSKVSRMYRSTLEVWRVE